jgi:hypothetical protein
VIFCNLPVFFFQEEVNESNFGDELMTASEKDTCQRCGAVIPGESTDKLCPACLLSGALQSPKDEAVTVSMTPGESLLLYGPSELPC